ncbi:hypothetical protein FGIG_04087 [Fasciola gigantica]|uniref:Ig-like domain-containing protein n=1 Tax=Fasciola gigantica TaxID=46835 RepID=A0A504YTF2_FASGI|nr:hypothetical protein FGIG_04087 [Fasciola gigantica]
MEGPPATLTFFVNPLFVAGPKDAPNYEHNKPEFSSETEFNRRQITNKQSFPSITLNCSFVTTTQTTVQWLFQPRADRSKPWSVIEPEKAGSSSSIVPEYQLETQASLLSEVNLWHIRSVLTIPQTPSSPLWEMNLVDKCTVEQAANLLQRERMEATYRCEATNAYGRTERTSKISVVYSPLPLGCQDQFVAVPAQETDQPVGPIFCQFSSRPPIEKVIWWQHRRNRLEKIYQSDKLIHPIELQDNTEFLIISGSPALLPDILSKNHPPSRLHILESMKNAWKSEHTFFTALWIKHFSSSNATLYQCEVTSAVGNRSFSRSITAPSQPHKVVNLEVHGITWTTVHLSWTPGFHGLQIPVTSPFLRIYNLTGVSMDLTRRSLETLYNRQLREISRAQHFLILLDDHGYRAQTGAVTDQAKLSASWSELSLPQDELISRTNQIRLRIGSSDHVNLTDIVVHNPERIVVDRTSSTIRLSADNPAMCARIESAAPSSGIWLPVKFSNSEYVVQTADGQYTTNYPMD